LPRSLIVYFSQGGTTARIGESIAAGLKCQGYQVDAVNLAQADGPSLEGYDCLGIGAPAYYFRPPFPVVEYIRGLNLPPGLPAFVFVLHGTYCGDAGNILRRRLARKGAREVGYFSSLGADYYLGYLRQGYLFSPERPSKEDLERAEQFGRDLPAHIASPSLQKAKPDEKPGWIYRLERAFTCRWLVHWVHSGFFVVDKEKCSKCGLCADSCPTRNILHSTDTFPEWGRHCIFCVMCEMNCPENAITSTTDWSIFQPFLRYNVHRASRDSSLVYWRVKHTNGQTERLPLED
jgi:flavodoxin/Pyruvate/2-oxoacid:ferredoxin oxidoreductase delta subunit